MRGAGCRLCDATAFKRSKGNAALAFSKLVDVYGSRLVLESAADYLRKFLGLSVWAARFDAANAELVYHAELYQLRREVKRLRRSAARWEKLAAAA